MTKHPFPLRRTLKITGIAAAAVVMLLVLLSSLILMPPVQRSIKNLAEIEISKQLTGLVTIGRIRSNVISRIDLYDVVMKDPGGSGDSIAIKHLGCRYLLPRLLDKKLDIRSIRLDRVSVAGIRDCRGKALLPFLPRPRKAAVAGKKSPWSIELHSVRLRKVSAFWTDSLLSISAGLKEMDIDLTFHALDSFDFTLSTGQGWAYTPWWDGPVSTIRSGGTISPRSLLLRKTMLNAGSTTISGRGRIPFTNYLPWDLSAELETDLKSVKNLRSVKGLDAGGSAKARARWIGPMVGPRLTVSALGRGLTVHGVRIEELTFSGSYDENGKLAGTAIAATALGRANIAADLDLPHLMTRPRVGGYLARFDLDGIAVNACAKAFGIRQPIPSSTASIHGGMKGAVIASLPDSLEAKLSVTFPDTPDTGAFVSAHASMIHRQWMLEAACGTRNTMQTRGGFTPAGDLKGIFSFSMANPAAVSGFFMPDRLTGTLRGDGAISGTLKKPQVNAAVSGNAVVWKSVTVDTIALGISYLNKQLTFSDAVAQAHGSLDTVLPGLHLPAARGKVTLVAQGSGSIADPALSIHAKIADPGFKTYSARHITADASFSHGTLTLQKLTADKGAGVLTATGSFGIKRTFFSGNLAISLERKGFNPVSFSASGSLSKDTIAARIATGRCSVDDLAPWLPKPLPLRGVFSLDSHLSGALKNPEAGIEFNFDQILKSTPLVRYRGSASLRDSTLSASLAATLSGSANGVSLTASLPLTYRKPFSIPACILEGAIASVKAENINIAPFLGLVDSTMTAKGAFSTAIDLQKSAGSWRIRGTGGLMATGISAVALKLRMDTLSLRALASGTLGAPVVSVDFANSSASWKSLSLLNGAGRVELSQDTLLIDTLRGRLGKGSIGISGRAPLHGMRYYPLVKNGLLLRYSLDEIPISPFSRAFDGPPVKSGTLSGTGRIETSASGPDFNGSLRLKNARVQFADCDEPFGPVNAELLLKGDSLIIKSLQGNAGTTGKLRGSGFLRLEKSGGGIGRTDMRLSTSDLRLHCVDFDAGIEKANVSLTDSAGGLLLNADVKLAESRYATYLSVASLLSQKQRQRPTVKPSGGFLDKVNLTARIRLEQNLEIETNFGQFRLDGAIAVIGTMEKPGISGSVDIVEGYIYYLDRKFTIQSGSLRIPSAERSNPLIALVAESDQISENTISGGSTNYQITLKVQGDAQKPEIVLTSEPFLRQEQIVSLLTLGTTEGGIGNGATQRVVSLVQQQLAGFGNRKLERLLGVESINIEPVFRADSSGATASIDNSVLSAVKNQDAVVTAVKRITPRLTVQYQTDLKDLGKPNAVVSYRVLPFLYVDGTGNNVGNVGLDLRLRFSR